MWFILYHGWCLGPLPLFGERIYTLTLLRRRRPLCVWRVARGPIRADIGGSFSVRCQSGPLPWRLWTSLSGQSSPPALSSLAPARFSCLNHARRPRRSAPRKSTTVFSSSQRFDRYHNLPCSAPRKCPRTLLQQQQQLPAAVRCYKFGTMIGVMIVVLSLPTPCHGCCHLIWLCATVPSRKIKRE